MECKRIAEMLYIDNLLSLCVAILCPDLPLAHFNNFLLTDILLSVFLEMKFFWHKHDACSRLAGYYLICFSVMRGFCNNYLVTFFLLLYPFVNPQYARNIFLKVPIRQLRTIFIEQLLKLNGVFESIRQRQLTSQLTMRAFFSSTLQHQC